MSDSNPFTTRAEGRDRSQSATELLIARLQTLAGKLGSSAPENFPAFCFLAEQTAWSCVQTARALLFDARSEHLPKSDGEMFAAWVKQEWIGLAESRRLKQFCELRNLSAQDPALLDESGIRDTVRESLPFITEFLITAKRVDVLHRR